jgi:diguanylate cyclase (GGDEF)-like protein
MFRSLRSALLVPFVGVVVLVAASISALSYYTGVKAVDQLAEQLLLDISNRVADATTRHLAASSVALNSVAPSLPRGAPDQQPASLAPVTMLGFEQRLWMAANLFDEGESYVYYGANNGEFIGLRRDKAGNFELRVREGDTPTRAVHEVSGPGLAARGRLLRIDNYDPRTRPWFLLASQRGGLTWSPVYVDFTTHALTVTLAKPIYTAESAGRALRGVVATDIPLTVLAEFVRGLQVSRTGVAFIVERDGTLIATSTSDKLFSNAATQSTRLRADQSTHPLVRQAYAQLQENKLPARTQVRDKDVVHYAFDNDQGRVHMSASAQRDSAGLDWTMVVAIPRADHMGDLRRTVIENVLIGMLAVCAAIAAGLWIMQRVTGDVRRLSEATRLLARGQSPERMFAEREDELGVIAKAMEDFKDGLLTDPLTGALTRSAFEKRFANFIAAHADVKLALLFVDLDRFKRINDEHGHAVGDAVLAICAQRIASVMRKDDMLARFGGDEFVMMLPGVMADDTLDRQISRVSAVLSEPITLAGSTTFARGSCGGALFTRDGDSLDQLVKVADARMYAAKRARKAASSG